MKLMLAKIPTDTKPIVTFASSSPNPEPTKKSSIKVLMSQIPSKTETDPFVALAAKKAKVVAITPRSLAEKVEQAPKPIENKKENKFQKLLTRNEEKPQKISLDTQKAAGSQEKTKEQQIRAFDENEGNKLVEETSEKKQENGSDKPGFGFKNPTRASIRKKMSVSTSERLKNFHGKEQPTKDRPRRNFFDLKDVKKNQERLIDIEESSNNSSKPGQMFMWRTSSVVVGRDDESDEIAGINHETMLLLKQKAFEFSMVNADTGIYIEKSEGSFEFSEEDD